MRTILLAALVCASHCIYSQCNNIGKLKINNIITESSCDDEDIISYKVEIDVDLSKHTTSSVCLWWYRDGYLERECWSSPTRLEDYEFHFKGDCNTSVALAAHNSLNGLGGICLNPKVTFVQSPIDNLSSIRVNSFVGSNENGENIVRWKTEREKGAEYFIVEKGNDIDNFQQIDVVQANNKPSNYLCTDYNTGDINYYRLKIVNRDGDYKYSETITVNSREENTVNVYNDLNGDIIMVARNSNKPYVVKVYDLSQILIFENEFVNSTIINKSPEMHIYEIYSPEDDYQITQRGLFKQR